MQVLKSQRKKAGMHQSAIIMCSSSRLSSNLDTNLIESKSKK
jgi:hypothetical protein